jgi:hypothetical protein
MSVSVTGTFGPRIRPSVMPDGRRLTLAKPRGWRTSKPLFAAYAVSSASRACSRAMRPSRYRASLKALGTDSSALPAEIRRVRSYAMRNTEAKSLALPGYVTTSHGHRYRAIASPIVAGLLYGGLVVRRWERLCSLKAGLHVSGGYFADPRGVPYPGFSPVSGLPRASGSSSVIPLAYKMLNPQRNGCSGKHDPRLTH